MTRAGSNGFDPDMLASYVKRYESLEAQIAEINTEAAEQKKDIKLDKQQLCRDAKHDGVNVKALKAAVKQRKLERQARALSIGLDIDELSQLEQMRHALGDLADTPLGQAATAA